MEKVVETNSYIKFTLDNEQFISFKALFSPSRWVKCKTHKVKEIPISIFNASLIHSELDFDDLQDQYLDSNFKTWAESFLAKNFNKVLSGVNYKISGVAAWNGAIGSSWHSDNDGKDEAKDSYTFLIYYLPKHVTKSRQGNLQIKNISTNEVDEICIESKDVIVLKLTEDNLHRSIPIESEEFDRYTFSIGVEVL